MRYRVRLTYRNTSGAIIGYGSIDIDVDKPKEETTVSEIVQLATKYIYSVPYVYMRTTFHGEMPCRMFRAEHIGGCDFEVEE